MSNEFYVYQTKTIMKISYTEHLHASKKTNTYEYNPTAHEINAWHVFPGYLFTDRLKIRVCILRHVFPWHSEPYKVMSSTFGKINTLVNK